MERKNIKAQAEVQSAASSQAGQENVAAVSQTPGLPGFVDGKDIYCCLRDTLLLRVGDEIRALFGLAHCLLVKHWMFILNYSLRMLGNITSCGWLCCRGIILPSKDIARGFKTLN